MLHFTSKEWRSVRSENYNYDFNTVTGFFARWGATKEEDPIVAPAPEILDLEVSYGGKCFGNCAFCYKGNGGDQPVVNMTLDQFKVIFSKMPKTLTQIAFGIMNISTNPDLFSMMEYARENGVVPNYTCHGLDVTPEIAKRTSELCGAVAVSVYSSEASYNAIKMFTDAGMKQVNIHFMLSEETYERAFTILHDRLTDPRLAEMNAIVFLGYKPKGRNAGGFHPVSTEKYKKLIEYCNRNNISYGFDSCSAPVVLKCIENSEDYKRISQLVEPCESSCFSSYINADGIFYACSFCEGEGMWKEGIDVLNCNDFVKDVWQHPKTVAFREILHQSTKSCGACKSQSICRHCPMFPVTNCHNEL
jgi:hypothetical protein